jgi:prepilin-type N-terminal cleavage/methylation domain-containing protein
VYPASIRDFGQKRSSESSGKHRRAPSDSLFAVSRQKGWKLAMRHTRRLQQGFSLLEALVALGIMLIVTAFAMVQSFGSVESYRVNSAMDIIISQLRVARQLAISQRRNVTVSFTTATSPQKITYQIVADYGTGLSNADTYAPPAVIVPIPPQVSFTQVAGVPDTPMAFGTCSGGGICIGGVPNPTTTMQFNSLGQFTDGTAVNTLNGTIFLALPNQINTARAVTILGSTGRVRQYTYIGTSGGWIE